MWGVDQIGETIGLIREAKALSCHCGSQTCPWVWAGREWAYPPLTANPENPICHHKFLHFHSGLSQMHAVHDWAYCFTDFRRSAPYAWNARLKLHIVGTLLFGPIGLMYSSVRNPRFESPTALRLARRASSSTCGSRMRFQTPLVDYMRMLQCRPFRCSLPSLRSRSSRRFRNSLSFSGSLRI